VAAPVLSSRDSAEIFAAEAARDERPGRAAAPVRLPLLMGRDVVDRVWLLTDLVLPPNDLVDLVLLFIDRVLLLRESCR